MTLNNIKIGLVSAFALLSFLSTAVKAQNCNYNISYDCWFTEQTNIRDLSWDPLNGNKLAVHQGGGQFCGSSVRYPVLDMSSGTVTRNVTLSQNYGAGATTANIVYASTGGIFMNNYYITPSGTQITASVGGYNIHSVARSANRDTVVFVSNNGGSYHLNFANVDDPENPVFSQIPNIYGISNNSTGLPGSEEAIATAGNRIYIATNNMDVANDPVIVKCRDFDGNTCPNWSDVTITAGKIYDIEVRPTDGMVFVRGNQKTFGSSGSQRAVTGLVIFDSTGALATGFNFSDLSLITGGYPVYADGGGKYLIRFDNHGNIFANMPMLEGSTAHGIGIYKFDPKGNLDIDFMRNVTNSYSWPGVTAVDYFDVNPVTGELATVMNNGSTWPGSFHALLGGEHKQGNNEMWDSAFQSIGVGDGAADIPGYPSAGRGSSGYNIMHILYNNGKLKVQGEASTAQTNNCGAATPAIVPYKDPALGVIQCSGLSFMAAPVAGTPSTLVVKVPVDVTTPGIFKPVTVSGSGMTMQDPYATFNAGNIGINDFYLTLKYDGSALGTFQISVGGAGSCAADLTDQTKSNPSIINIWTPENCTYKVTGPELK